MDKVMDNLYIGSASDALHRKDQLKANGVTAILNVARDLTNTTTTHKEFKLYHVGLMDGSGNDQGLYIAAVQVLESLLRAGETVLIHCHEGASRSAVITALYLHCNRDFQSLESAEEYLKSVRPRVSIKKPLLEEAQHMLLSSNRGTVK
jgi:protein-tyrosine phosphatase